MIVPIAECGASELVLITIICFKLYEICILIGKNYQVKNQGTNVSKDKNREEKNQRDVIILHFSR